MARLRDSSNASRCADCGHTAMVVVAITLGCGNSVTGGAGGAGASNDGGTTGIAGSPAGGDGPGGGGRGGGGQTQIPSHQASTAEECKFYGIGGAEVVYCDYITVDFSQPLPMPNVEVEVDTSFGDHLTTAMPSTPGVRLELSPDEGEALGFAIQDGAPGGGAEDTDHYSPDWITAVVRLDGQLVGEQTIAPNYTCVEITMDNWCWKGAPETMTVSAP